MTTQETITDGPSLTTTDRRKTSFAGDTLRLVSGTAMAQAMNLIAAPFLTRLYAPEAFGILALFTSITSILRVIACLRYELAIVLPESDEEAANLLGVSMAFSGGIALLTVPIVWWGGGPLLRALNAPELAPYLWMVPLVMFFGGIGVGHPALNYWATRTRRFKELSITRVISTATATGAQFGLGMAGFVAAGSLVGGSVLGAILSPLVLAWDIWRSDKQLFLRAINLREMLAGVKRYRKFPLYSTWAALLNAVSWQLPAFLLSAFFSTTVVGFYALGFRIIQLPMSLIGSSLGQVFFQRAAEAKVNSELDSLVETTFRQLIMFGLFPMLLLSIIGPELFTVLFGIEWTEAGIYTQILAPWAFVWFISSPLSTLTMVLEEQEFGLYINVLIFVTRLGSLAIGGFLNSVYIALILFSVSGVLVYGYFNLWLMNLAGISWRKVFHIIGPYLAVFLPVAGILVLMKLYEVSDWSVLAVAFACGILYLLYLVKTVPQFRTVIRPVSFDNNKT